MNEFDELARRAGERVRQEALSIAHTQDALDALKSNAVNARPISPNVGRRWIVAAGLVAAVSLGAGVAFLWPTAQNATIVTGTVPPSGPTDSEPLTTNAAGTSNPATSPATETTESEQVTSTIGPEARPGQNDEQAIAGLLAGLDWESSGIPRACAVESPDGAAGCTQVVHDPSGVPIGYDVTTRTITRHVREDGAPVQAVLPESYGDGVWIVAAGPDAVVYLNAVEQRGPEGSADLVAMSLAPGDAGREIERAVGSGNSGHDADFVVTANGLVTTDWYGQGQRPAADRTLVMPWVDRDPADDGSPQTDVDPHPNDVDAITIDAYEHTVTVNGRTWQLTGTAAEFSPTGMPPIVRTFDGGFIARYDEVVNEYRSVVVRGWPDGSVEEWIAPGGPDGVGWSIVPEPMGSVLIANGDSFARATPFDPRPPAWDGRLEVDVDTGEVDVTALNNYLATLDWTVSQPSWDLDPIAFANTVAGPLSSPAELRTIRLLVDDGQSVIVSVTDERFLDDSVYATRLELSITSDKRSVETIRWTNSCQPGRGHQTFEAAYCI